MLTNKINNFSKLPTQDQVLFFNELNKKLEKLSADKRIDWSINYLPKNFMLSSSFGIHSVVLLHLLIQKIPNIPVTVIDTGYLFPETYKFIDQLTEELNLNLKIFSAKKSPAWQESKYGKLWEQGLKGIEKYNFINKVKPMKSALETMSIKTWFSGLRRIQSDSRKKLKVLSIVQKKIFKMLPIVDWNNKKIYYYMRKNNLKFHPLWNQGYLTVGDIHTTSKWRPGEKTEKTRFFGLKRECGINEI